MFKPDKTKDKLEIDESMLDNFRDDILDIMAAAINERMSTDVIPWLAPSNFTGDALDFMAEHSIEKTDEMLKLYSTNALNECRDGADTSATVDKSDHKINISKVVIDTELGTMSMPVMKTITKSAELSLKGKK